jgi:hypothetical protein
MGVLVKSELGFGCLVVVVIIVMMFMGGGAGLDFGGCVQPCERFRHPRIYLLLNYWAAARRDSLHVDLRLCF